MRRVVATAILSICVAASFHGCCLLDMGFQGIPGTQAYEMDSSKFGSGEQVITPKRDVSYWDGEPMDQRQER